MARVNLESYAFDDTRFDLLAASVPHMRDRWHALGYVARVWHACASRRIKQLRPIELAGLLGYRRPLQQHDAAVVAFCDQAGLGERVEDGMVRVRGTDGRTDYLENDGDELLERIKAHVAECGPQKRADIMRGLELQPSQRSTFYAAISKALQAGVLSEDKGLIALGTDTGDDGFDASNARPTDVQWKSSRTSKTRSLVPVLDPVLALDPAPSPPETKADSAPARVDTTNETSSSV